MKKLMALVLALGMTLGIVGTAGAVEMSRETEWVRVEQVAGRATAEEAVEICDDAGYDNAMVRYFRDRWGQQQSWIYCSMDDMTVN